MDEFARAVEATLFASAEPLTVDEIAAYVGEGDVEVALGQLAGALRGPWRRAGRARRALAFPDRARPRPPPAPRARGAAPPVARRDRDAGDHRLSRAGQPRRDRGDPRRADLQGHARRADGGGLGAHRRPPRGAGPAAALCDDAGVPDPFRPRLAPRPAGHRRSQGRRPARSARRSDALQLQLESDEEED